MLRHRFYDTQHIIFPELPKNPRLEIPIILQMQEKLLAILLSSVPTLPLLTGYYRMSAGGAIMQRWDELAKKFSRTTDRLGMPIDAGIFETVVVLNALGIHTMASCEGHLDHGLPCPWVDIHEPSFVSHDPPEIQ